MSWFQKEIQIDPKPRGFNLITNEILDKGKGGLLFTIGDYKSLANKIEYFIKSKNQMIQKKRYAHKRLNRFDYKLRLHDYYKAICS